MSNLEIREFLELYMKGFRAELKAVQEIQDIYHAAEIKKMDEVIGLQKTTNGRVCKIESDTLLVSWAKAHPVLTILFFIGAVIGSSWVGQHLTIKEVIELIK